MTQAHAQALRLAGQLGREPEPPLVWSLAMAALTRGEWEPARGFAGQLRARAERDDDQVLWVESGYLQGIAAYWPGRLTAGPRPFRGGHGALPPERRRAHVLRYGQDPELLVRLRLAHTLWLLGRAAEADRQRDLALRAAAESSHGYSRAVTWVWAAIVAVDRGEVAEFRRHALALAAAPADEGPAQVRLAAELFAGHLSVLDGRTDAGPRRACGRCARSSPAARRPRPACPASPPACCSRATRWLGGPRPDSRWPARRSDRWAAAPSCGRPRSGGCARRFLAALGAPRR